MEALEPVDVQRARCEEQRDALCALARIHIDIDAPKRSIAPDEPDWVFRLRKVCLHAVAITKCKVSADGMHVMAAELRPAYEQMDDVWKRLPDEFRFAADGSWWSREARKGLAAYNHPTMVSLALPLATGGLAEAEDPRSYLLLAVWLGRLACGYALALAHLARVLGATGDFDSRLTAVVAAIRV
jgi:hypothetical protein